MVTVQLHLSPISGFSDSGVRFCAFSILGWYYAFLTVLDWVLDYCKLDCSYRADLIEQMRLQWAPAPFPVRYLWSVVNVVRRKPVMVG